MSIRSGRTINVKVLWKNSDGLIICPVSSTQKVLNQQLSQQADNSAICTALQGSVCCDCDHEGHYPHGDHCIQGLYFHGWRPCEFRWQMAIYIVGHVSGHSLSCYMWSLFLFLCKTFYLYGSGLSDTYGWSELYSSFKILL